MLRITIITLLLSWTSLCHATDCPCICRAGFSKILSEAECFTTSTSSPSSCTVSECTRPSGASAIQCCDVSLPPTPSATPTTSMPPTAPPSVTCPCVCRLGFFQRRAARRECRSADCDVMDCERNGIPGTSCCNASMRPTPAQSLPPCPCRCRTGAGRRAAARRECGRDDTPERCVVARCNRSNGGRGVHCCDPES